MKRLKLLQISNKYQSINNIPLWLKSYGPWVKQLKLIRETLGMTQKQLATRIRSTQISISRLENNEVNPTLDTMNKIAEALNCELFINMVPRKEIIKLIEEKAEKKAEELLAQSIGNAAMEIQRPGKDIIDQSKKELINDIITNKRTTLW
ncbi:MAG: helix-turn-helix domain-containing protein [Candidatus Margulisiibacteriota bacterium]